MLSGLPIDEIEGYGACLEELETSLSALLMIVRSLFTRVKKVGGAP
jgi:hypothetical protein